MFTQLLLADEINRAPGQDAVRPARGDARGERDRRWHHAAAAAPVLRDGHAEPHRVAGHLPPARSPARPLPAQDRRGPVHRATVEKQILRNHLGGFNPTPARSRRRGWRPWSTRRSCSRCRPRSSKSTSVTTCWSTSPTSSRARGLIARCCSARRRAGRSRSRRPPGPRPASKARDFIIPDDVKALAPAVLRHRLILQPDAEFEGLSADICIEQILGEAQVPKTAA